MHAEKNVEETVKYIVFTHRQTDILSMHGMFSAHKKCCSLFNSDNPAEVNQEIAASIEQH
jgi:hypothetical protein